MEYRDNLEINLIDMLYHILKKWRMLLLWMIIGAIILGAYGYRKSTVQVNEDTGETIIEEAKTDITSLKAKLTSEQISVAENTAEQYLEYLREYNDLSDYKDKSVFLNIDSHNAPRMTATYIIDDYSDDDLVVVDDVDDSDSKWIGMLKKKLLTETNNIASIYRRELISNEIVEKVKQKCGINFDSGAINELIGVGIEGDNILYLVVYGKDESMCSEIMDALQDAMDEATAQVKKTYDYNITPVGRYYLEVNDTSIYNMQKEYYSYLYTLRYNRAALANLLPAESKEYYLAITNLLEANVKAGTDTDSIGNIHDFVEDVIANTPIDATEPIVETKTVRIIDKKFIFIGLFGGLLVAVLWYAILYILSSKLHTANDMRDAFKVTVLGEMGQIGTSKGLDKFISRIFGEDNLLPEDEQLQLISSEVRISAEKTNTSKVQIIGVSDDVISENASLKIKDSLRGGALIVRCGKSVICDPEAMNMLADSDAVVLVEKIGASSYADIARELEMCSKFGVKVLGAVVLR